MTAHTTLRTMEEHDDARVRHAFAAARRPSRVHATLETEKNPRQETRDAVVTVTADSKSNAVSGLTEITEAMQRAFAQEGRAAGWLEGRATIKKSEVEVERHRFAGEATKVKNLAVVSYEYSVGATVFEGDRISLGDAPADRVDETLKRYPVGATVPVYYDPANPEESVLERDPPAKLGRMWAGVILFTLIYGGVGLSFWNGISINHAVAAALPQVHHPLFTIGAGLLGLLSLSSGIWNWAHPHQTKASEATRDKPDIVSKGSVLMNHLSSLRPIAALRIALLFMGIVIAIARPALPSRFRHWNSITSRSR